MRGWVDWLPLIGGYLRSSRLETVSRQRSRLQRARKDAADEASRDREAKIREEMVAVELSAARAEGERRAAASVEILKRTQQEEYAKAKARQAQEATVSASDRKAEAFGRMSDPEFIRQNGLDSFDKKRG